MNVAKNMYLTLPVALDFMSCDTPLSGSYLCLLTLSFQFAYTHTHTHTYIYIYITYLSYLLIHKRKYLLQNFQKNSAPLIVNIIVTNFFSFFQTCYWSIDYENFLFSRSHIVFSYFIMCRNMLRISYVVIIE